VELLGKFESSEELDRSNLNSINRILPEVDRSNINRSIETSQNLLLQKRARTPNQELLHDKKAVLPLIFTAEHAGFVTLVVSSKRGTLEGVRGVILHGFLALISFYKSHSHASFSL
jgi:hypothetical protein